MYDLSISEQQTLQDVRAREPESPTRAEWRAEIVVGGFALLAVALLWFFPVESRGSLLAGAACVLGMVATTFVRFDVGGGFTVPLQLAFVPLLFAVPAQAVPLGVIAAMAAARVPAVVRRESSRSRLTFAVSNAWFAIGPAAVLVAIGGADEVIRHPALALPLIAAQFAGDFAASTLRESMLRGTSLKAQLREAAWVYGVDAALTPVPLVLIVEGTAPAVAVLVTMSIVVLIASFARERSKRLDGLFELNNAYHGTALLLGDVVEADDHYTGEHSRGVVALALDVGCELGLCADRLRNLEFSALLHDVGKVAIPKEIINKPGRLDPREWEIIKTHTVEGQRMLDRIGGFMGDVGRIVRSHHERWDGGGYPDGLVGDAIPLEARIVTACDSFSAMTTNRPYRAAMPAAVAIEELRANAGSQFDPAVVEALLATMRPVPAEGAEAAAAPAPVARAA